ncbi:hypothetical protein K457DRAFT_874125 [Linnemannia elongata AG-77]|uniref:Uncharacterized protein n=1 Tax=Linnemannia elongata AG-77 TaxID=1314771 RepID=A0A197JG83_9FUNG|nr:hypothetical protein K457DRAFT_874125 [Linnemannia elongata AG-77]
MDVTWMSKKKVRYRNARPGHAKCRCRVCLLCSCAPVAQAMPRDEIFKEKAREGREGSKVKDMNFGTECQELHAHSNL